MLVIIELRVELWPWFKSVLTDASRYVCVGPALPVNLSDTVDWAACTRQAHHFSISPERQNARGCPGPPHGWAATPRRMDALTNHELIWYLTLETNDGQSCIACWQNASLEDLLFIQWSFVILPEDGHHLWRCAFDAENVSAMNVYLFKQVKYQAALAGLYWSHEALPDWSRTINNCLHEGDPQPGGTSINHNA